MKRGFTDDSALFRGGLTGKARAELWRRLSARLDERRRRHVRAVADVARELAALHGVDEESAELAALFHDWFRGTAAEDIDRFAREWGLDAGMADDISLLHGHLAAELMEREYGVTDEDTLNAVRYHTTGRAGMSDLEMIIYVADKAEPGREYPGAGGLRAAAARDLRSACAEALENAVIFLKKNNHSVDMNSERALEWIRGAGERTEGGDSLIED